METRLIRRAARAISIAAALTCASAANATVTVFGAGLTGPNEFPTNSSPGTGTAIVTIDDVAHTLAVQIVFSGLTGTTTASHIHAPTPSPLTGVAGVATTIPTFAGFPLGVTSGTYSATLSTLDLSTYNPAFVTANGGTAASAEAALFAAMLADRSYLNIHTSTFGGGEIRGFLIVVPEAATWMMMLAGFGALGLVVRRRRPLATA